MASYGTYPKVEQQDLEEESFFLPQTAEPAAVNPGRRGKFCSNRAYLLTGGFLVWGALIFVLSSPAKQANHRNQQSARRRHHRHPEAAKIWEDVFEEWHCDDFDDDALITPADCGGSDRGMCSEHCTTGMCLELCGSACVAGEGALCAYQALADLDRTCAEVAALLLDRGVTVDEEIALEALVPSQDCWTSFRPPGEGGWPEPRNGEGEPTCDHHTWCTFCSGSQECMAIVPKAPNSMRVESGGCAAAALRTITSTCSESGRWNS